MILEVCPVERLEGAVLANRIFTLAGFTITRVTIAKF
jgi:hypothetical protein